MKWILGIDTSSTQLDIGLLKDGQAAGSYTGFLPNSHAEKIKDAVKFMMASNDLTPEDLSCLGVTVGPGSFTGLRIGISFIKGFLFGRNIPVVPVSSLMAIACAWPCREGILRVIIEARGGKVFFARFSGADGIFSRLSEDCLAPLSEACEYLGENETVLIDTMGYRGSTIPHAFARHSRAYTLSSWPVQRGVSAAKTAWMCREDSGQRITAADLLPRYLQQSAAEKKASVKWL